MPTEIEHWIATVHAALPDAEFLSLEPEDGIHALLAAVWLQEGRTYRIITFGNQPYGKPDCVLDMEAADPDQAQEWALALLQFLDDNRQSADLVPGGMFAADQPLVDFAPLQGWLLGLACTLETLGLQTPHAHIYPIYKAEVATCKAVGLAQFLKKAGQEIRNPSRPAHMPPHLN